MTMTENDKLPPYSEEAERAVLGAMLMEPVRVIPMATVTYRLKESAFYAPAHQAIAGALFEMFQEKMGSNIDLLTFEEFLKHKGMLDEIGGGVFLETLVDKMPTAAHAEHYLDIVRKKWIARGIIDRSREIRNEAYTTDEPEKLLLAASQRYTDVVSEIVRDEPLGEIMDGSLQRWRDAKAFKEGDQSKKPAIGIETPWQAFTAMTCGLEPGLYVVAGRPSAGKTTLEDCLSLHAAELGIPVARATADSTKRKLLDRSICRYANVSLPKLKFGFTRKDQLEDCAKAAKYIAGLPFYINDQLTDVESICAWARMMKARKNIGLFTFDYIQQARVGTASRFVQDNDNARVQYISSAFKRLWKELGIPVVILSQLNRAVEKESRDPKMSDLRDSGAIEQDADVVIFLYKDTKKADAMEETTRGATKHKRPVWFHQVKHKEAEIGRIPMWLFPPYFKFEPAESDDEQDFADDNLPLIEHAGEGKQRSENRDQRSEEEEQQTQEVML